MRCTPSAGHAEFLVTGKSAHYIFIVKKNQPGLYAQLKRLPWRQVPAGARQHDRGHGRDEHRTLKAVNAAAGLAFPHAAQAICLTRRIRPPGRREVADRHGLRHHQPGRPPGNPGSARRLDTRPLAHRGATSHQRRHLPRRPLPGPHRQRPPGHGHAGILAIAIIKLAGAASIAAATRHYARNAARPLATLGPIPA